MTNPHEGLLYCRQTGDQNRPAIVFLHGGGLSSRQWQPQFDALSQDFYCLAPDLPEQGHSAALKPFTLSDAAHRTAALIQTYIPSGRSHLVGLSLGGAVALEVVRLYPQLIDRVIVSGTSAGLPAWLGAIASASSGLYKWFSRERLVNMAYQQFAIPESQRELVREDLLNTMTAEFNRSSVRALMEIQLPASANLLVLVGENETFVAKRDARTLTQRIEGARGCTVPQAGHVWNLQAPELFNQTVRAWLTDAALPQTLNPF